jgi:antitoxin ParD1/3/4
MPSESSMNVSLTSELHRYVQSRVRSGQYASASEVVREGLRMLQQHDADRKVAVAELRRQIAAGEQAAERGEVVSAKQAFDKIKSMSRERRRRRAV